MRLTNEILNLISGRVISEIKASLDITDELKKLEDRVLPQYEKIVNLGSEIKELNETIATKKLEQSSIINQISKDEGVWINEMTSLNSLNIAFKSAILKNKIPSERVVKEEIVLASTRDLSQLIQELVSKFKK